MTRFRLLGLILIAGAALVPFAQGHDRVWLAGDSHIHSHWSPGWDRSTDPPTPAKGEDALYSTPLNARMAAAHGLSWMVTTDHGGPNHSKINLHEAYAELLASRKLVPKVLQFYGLELNMPAMDHHTVVVPHADDEWAALFEIEHRFDANEPWPADPERDTEAAAQAALAFMKVLPRPPLVFANHPSRSAKGLGQYGRDEPHEFRNNNDIARAVYRGMEGAPGHQAGTLAPDGSVRRSADGAPAGARGSYSTDGARTMGGFDQMTVVVGGLWDALLGEGRRFWIVATSDSHVHYTETTRSGSDFWPGEYQKTYVHALKTYEDVLDGLRSGRIFVTSGDLISSLDVTASAGGRAAAIGGTLTTARGARVDMEIRFHDPRTTNARGDNPSVARVDVIIGAVAGPVADRSSDRNPSTRVAARFPIGPQSETEEHVVRLTLPPLDGPIYLRVRGTNTADLEPPMDPPGEDPWTDLWFYSNPIFIEIEEGGSGEA